MYHDDSQHTGRGAMPGMGVATGGVESAPVRVRDHGDEAA